jgi:hypothetical protein
MKEPEMSGPGTALVPINPRLSGQMESDDRPSRLKFWEIECFFKCPVIGICLTSSEQRQVLKKAGISFRRRSAFEVHEILVSAAEKKGSLSERVDRLLNRKYASEIASLLDLDEKAFMAQWDARFQSGEHAGIFWAAATRADLSIQSRREVFGAIHMAMHGNAEQSARLRRNLAFQEEQARKMTLKAREAASSRKALQKEQARIQQAQTALSDRFATLEKENETLRRNLTSLNQGRVHSELESANASLREEVRALSAQIVEKDAHALSLLDEINRLSSELNRHMDLSNRLQKEAHELVRAMFVQKRCDESCPAFDLCKRRVLIVGGLTKLEALYRQLVEDSGGIFEYHDGYVKNGIKNLENRLRRADIVLCPTSCNSHAACSLVKSLGKKHNKQVCILASSSLSAMAQALSGNAGVYACGN